MNQKKAEVEALRENYESLKKKNKKLIEMIEEEREKIAGYEEIAKMHSAYIAILLKKLGATDVDNGVTISTEQAAAYLHKYEVRARPTGCEGEYILYCDEK